MRLEDWLGPVAEHLGPRLDNAGMSLNEYVVSRAVAAAVDDLGDRRVFALSADAWNELRELLDRPVAAMPRIAALLAEPSVLDHE